MLRFRPSLAFLSIILVGCASPTGSPQTQSPVRQHSDEFFQKLRQEEQRNQPGQPAEVLTGQTPPSPPVAQPDVLHSRYPDDQYLIATGHGVLAKGHLICQRVSETEARAELAKQIRVFVKEHAIDRVRERSGQPLEQDIEIVREEIANELLQDVKIIDRSIDEARGTCSSTAVMPKSRIAPKLGNSPEAISDSR